jgi:hypothetical protein
MISDQEIARLNQERKKRNLPLLTLIDISMFAMNHHLDETNILENLWAEVGMQHPTHPSMPGHERHEEWLRETEEAKKREAEGKV